jgi:hypothetical protein
MWTERERPAGRAQAQGETGNPRDADRAGDRGSNAASAGGGYEGRAALYAFGLNRYGELGGTANSGTESPNPTPSAVGLPAGRTVDTMAPGPSASHALALIADLAVTSSGLASGRVGAPYSSTASAEGGTAPYAWQASGLPAGLSIDAASGKIGGTPEDAGTAQVLLSVSDRFGITARSPAIALRIAPRPAISRLRQSHSRWRAGRRLAKVSLAGARRKGRRPPLGTTISLKLNAAATVRLAFARRNKGGRGLAIEAEVAAFHDRAVGRTRRPIGRSSRRA